MIQTSSLDGLILPRCFFNPVFGGRLKVIDIFFNRDTSIRWDSLDIHTAPDAWSIFDDA